MRGWLGWFALSFFGTAALALGVLDVAAYAQADNAQAHIKWQPDRGFAKVVKIGFEAANRGATVTEDVCMKPRLPKATALTAGVPQDDCLVVATNKHGGLCFELIWENGASGTRYACKLVRRAIRLDTKPGWVVHYPAPFTA